LNIRSARTQTAANCAAHGEYREAAEAFDLGQISPTENASRSSANFEEPSQLAPRCFWDSGCLNTIREHLTLLVGILPGGGIELVGNQIT
jgi:hypothetical protein